MLTIDEANDQAADAPALAAILRDENVRLKQALAAIQANLAKSVELNTTNVANHWGERQRLHESGET